MPNLINTIRMMYEERKFNEAKYPHMMYDPETGEGVEVKTPEEHEKYAKKGYTHDKEKVKEEVELDEKLNVKAIQKAVDDGKSMDVIVGMFANKRTTNTDEIRKIVKDYKFKKRKN